MRILCVLAIGVLLAGLGTFATHRAARAPGTASTVAPAALIDVGALFGGDEGEPDENEEEADDDEDGAAQPKPSRTQTVQQVADNPSMPSLAVVFLSLALALIVAAYVVHRIRRLWARARAWRPGR
jgi:hypothetical protein